MPGSPNKKPKLAEDDEIKIPVPRPPEQMHSSGKLKWEWYDSDEEDFADDSPPDIVYYFLESHYKAIQESKAEFAAIVRRRSQARRRSQDDHSREKDSSEAQTRKTPTKGRWLCIVPDPLYCEFCGKTDHPATDCRHAEHNADPSSEDWSPPVAKKCGLCMKFGHSAAACSYLYHVPKGATVGPDGILICKCCGQVNGHPEDEDWVGEAQVS